MKVQEVIMRAMAKQITWWQAAEILGVSTRTIRRRRRDWQKVGFDGLYDRRWKRPSPKRVPVKELEKILALYREKYSDFNVRHFHEKLREEHGIHYSGIEILDGAAAIGRVRNPYLARPHNRSNLCAALAVAKSPGATIPRTGWSQRISASTPTTPPERLFVMGWKCSENSPLRTAS